MLKIEINPIRKHIKDIVANDKNKKNNIGEILSKGKATGIPNNVPISIIGEKGSGKTTLLRAIMKIIHEEKQNEFRNIFFVYSPLTLDLELPEYITKIDIQQSENFLEHLFEIKSIYNSYVKFFENVKRYHIIEKIEKKIGDDDPDNEEYEKILRSFLNYCDNEIVKYNNEYINSGEPIRKIIDRVIERGSKVINRFSKPFTIDNILIKGLSKDQRDCVVIDDIAIASKVLFKDRKENTIYDYLTLSRHMRLLVIFSGQQVDQLPKMLRREIMCWILSKNTNIELLTGILSRGNLESIREKQKELGKYEFVIYNSFEDKISKI